MKEYVAGFLFFNRHSTQDISLAKQIVMIRKERPDWQKGHLNGVGGKVEPGEKIYDAMVREFFEETDIQTESAQWNHYATVVGPDYKVYFFKSFRDVLPPFKSKTDEKVRTLPVDSLILEKVIPSNRFLIPLAQDKDFIHTVVYTEIDPEKQSK